MIAGGQNVKEQQDWNLLRSFVDTGSQQAFAELTRRYLGLVYSACLRELHDPTLAEDTAQAVFLILARKAPAFRSHIVLAAWLFHTSRLTAKNVRRSEQRRLAQEANMARAMQQQENWTPVVDDVTHLMLNEALSSLPPGDRQAILLHCVCGYSFRETGQAINISEEAVRKRVTRALERLRRHLSRTDASITVVVVAEMLGAHTPHANLAQLESRVMKCVFDSAGANSTGSLAHLIAKGVLKSMNMTRASIAITCVAGLIGGIVGLQWRALGHFRSAPLTQIAASQAPDAPNILAVQGQPGTESRALELLRQMAQSYGALRTISFTETATGASAFDSLPYRMQFSYQRPDRFEIRITRSGKMERIIYQNSRVWRIPLDGSSLPQSVDRPPHYDPLATGVICGASVQGDTVTRMLMLPEKQLQQEWLRTRPGQTVLKGAPEVIAGVSCDCVIIHQIKVDRYDAPGDEVLMIGQQDHLIRKLTSQGEAGGARNDFTITYADVRVNRQIPPQTFRSRSRLP
jgi:RNA polymerase sigma factor (sigma-70 family)